MEIKISRIRRRVGRRGLVGNATRLLALTGLAACTGSQAPIDGVYEVEASMGEVTLPANLELDREGDTYRGRLTLMMGQPVHFALRSDGWRDDTLEFRTGSPATSMTLTMSGDSLRGVLMLPGGRAVNLAGARLAGETVSVQLLRQFDLEPFAPNVISEPNRGEVFPALSPSGSQIYFSAYDESFASQTTMSAQLINGTWTIPEVSSFSGQFSDRSPTVSPDGTRLLFASTRPRPGEGHDESYLIFATSAPHDGHAGNDDLYVSFNRDGQWTAPRNLGLPINSFANEYGAFVSRDGQYLYFTSDRHPPANLYRVAVGELLLDR